MKPPAPPPTDGGHAAIRAEPPHRVSVGSQALYEGANDTLAIDAARKLLDRIERGEFRRAWINVAATNGLPRK